METGLLVVLCLLSILALAKDQFGPFLSILLGTFISFLFSLSFGDGILGIIITSSVIYLPGKFIINKITEHRLHRELELARLQTDDNQPLVEGSSLI